jgi:NitT/TauT family transport system ATP-binding protein
VEGLGGAGAAPAPYLRADAVTLTYKTKTGLITALKDLTLGINRSEFVSVIGPSGCGKSTLLRAVSGLLPVTSGRIALGGVPVTGPRPEVGIVFQTPTLLPWKTVIENVLVPARALGLDAASSRAKAGELLRLVRLEAFADNYPNELSGGMQQRVGLARGLIHDPEILLMDEPFAALDAITRDRMGAVLQRLWMMTKKSVLFITHHIPEAVFLSDRIVTLSPRPARILGEVTIDFPRPRTLATMADPRFAELCNRLRAEFQDMFAAEDKAC